jgi:hypothetical protein
MALLPVIPQRLPKRFSAFLVAMIMLGNGNASGFNAIISG